MDNVGDNIRPIDELDDFEIAEGDPDVRGWTVLSADGKKIGEVDNLLVDVGVMKVRYLDVDVDDDLLLDDEERHILIPIGYARLDPKDDQIYVDELQSSRLTDAPTYRRQPVTSEYETSLRGYFDSLGGQRRIDGDDRIDFMI